MILISPNCLNKLLDSWDLPGLEPLNNILKELDLPLIPSYLLGINTTTNNIITMAKFKRVLGLDTFFSVDYSSDSSTITIGSFKIDDFITRKL